MSITLGNYTFDESRTTVVEKYEEVGGCDARVIQVKGIIDGLDSLPALEAALDLLLAASSTNGEQTALSLRPDRVLYVRRTSFVREVNRGAVVGSFTVHFEAADPYEVSTSERSTSWEISDSGQEVLLPTEGNVYSPVQITLEAGGTLIAPAFSDGTRRIEYLGTVRMGETLLLDGASGKVTLNGVDATPYTQGLLPRVSPGGTTLHYSDADDSSHVACARLNYRDRWW